MSFFNDELPPFTGIDIGWDGDPNFPIGDYEVIPDTAVLEADFVHFKIQVENESGVWKGYVGKGYLAGTRWDEVSAGGLNTQENWTQVNVTHEGTPIKLDVTDLPFDNGISDLIDGGKGKTLADSTTYYVYLDIEMGYEQIDQWNDFDSDEDGTTVIAETVQSVATLFLTAGERNAGDAETQNMGMAPEVDDPSAAANGHRYFLIGTVVTPAGDTGAQVGQIFRDAIAIETTIRGHRLDMDVGGLGIQADGDIVNTGVTQLIDGGSTAINISGGTGSITITDGP